MNIKKLAVSTVAVSLFVFAGAAWADVDRLAPAPSGPSDVCGARLARCISILEPIEVADPVPPPPMQQAGATEFLQGQSVNSEYMFSARMTSGNGNFNDTLVIQNSWRASSGIVGFQETVSVSASNDTITLTYVTLLGGTTVAMPVTATTKFVGSFPPKLTVKVTLESGFPTNGCVPPPPAEGLAKTNCGPGSYGRGGTLFYGGITVNGIETVTRTIDMAALPLNVVREWYSGEHLICNALDCDRSKLLKGTLTVGRGWTFTVGRSEDKPEWINMYPEQPWPWNERMRDYQQEICPPNSISPCKSTAPWYDFLWSPPQPVCPLAVVPGPEYFEIVIGEGVTHIGDYAFNRLNSRCNMGPMSVSIGPDVVSIGENAFANALWGGTTGVTIPDNVKKIGTGAFAASGITFVKIGAGVDTIMGSAFAYCENLKSVVSMNPVPPALITGFVPVFERIADDVCLYVPDESIGAYAGWGGFECVKPLGELEGGSSVSHRSRPRANGGAAAVAVRGRTLSVRMPTGSGSSAKISLINMRGKTVARYNVGANGNSPVNLPLANIPAGRYFVEVRDGVRRDRTSVVVGVR